MRLLTRFVGFLAVAFAALVKVPPVPRCIKHNLHPFMQRCYGKVVAGGSGSMLRPAYAFFAFAVTAALIVGSTLIASHLAGADAGGLTLAVGTVASNDVVEKRKDFQQKQKEVFAVLEIARDGDRFDLSRKGAMDLLGATSAEDALDKLKQRNRELDQLGMELQQAELKEIADSAEAREQARNTPVRGTVHPGRVSDTEIKSFGELFIATDEFKQSVKSKTSIPVMVDVSLKTLFETTAGFAPESTRTGRIVPAATRPIQVLDLIPSAPMSQAVEKYMEETTNTQAAAERAEGGVYAESTFEFTEKTSDVRSIGHSLPVTDEQLEDELQVSGLLDQRMRFGLRQRLDTQVINGNGTPPNLRGILNVVGIQTQAKGNEPAIVAFMRALTKVRVTGRAVPNGAVFHPNNWLAILLTQNANGDYIFGNPFQGPGPQSLFGIPVAQADLIAAGTGLVGDFANFCRIGERKGVEVLIGFVGDQFKEGKRTLRAGVRACFTVYRPAAFCTITGLAS